MRVCGGNGGRSTRLLYVTNSRGGVCICVVMWRGRCVCEWQWWVRRKSRVLVGDLLVIILVFVYEENCSCRISWRCTIFFYLCRRKINVVLRGRCRNWHLFNFVLKKVAENKRLDQILNFFRSSIFKCIFQRLRTRLKIDKSFCYKKKINIKICCLKFYEIFLLNHN